MSIYCSFVNSLGASDVSMRHQPRPSLVQMMACHLFGAKPLSNPMVAYFHSFSEIWIKIRCSLKKMNLNVVCKMASILSRRQCAKCSTQQELSTGFAQSYRGVVPIMQWYPYPPAWSISWFPQCQWGNQGTMEGILQIQGISNSSIDPVLQECSGKG